MKTLKEKFEQRELTIGSWLTFSDPAVAEMMAQSGFDWLAVDMEHSALSISQLQGLIRTIDLCGIPALVRVPENNHDLIKRIMDMGATGVIIPNVNSKQDAQDAVNAVKYPPFGKRGVGLGRAQKYSFDIENYRDWNEKNSIVLVQIEHIDAVNCLEEIMGVDGVDGFMLGLYDLTGSLNCIGEFDNPKVQAALDRVMTVSEKNNYLIGQHVVQTEPEAVQEKIKAGIKLIGYGTDFLFLGEYCRKSIKTLKEIQD